MKQDRWHAAAKTMKVQKDFPFSLELESSVGWFYFLGLYVHQGFFDDKYSCIAWESTDKLSLLYST
jgi:hypothetical protein